MDGTIAGDEKFAFFASYLEVAQKMGPEDRLSFYDAIATYGITGEVPEDITPIADIAFTVARHSIDKSVEKSKTNTRNGKRGGRPRTETEPKTNPKTEQKTEPETEKTDRKTEPKPTGKPKSANTETEPKPDIDLDIDVDVDKDKDKDGGSKGGKAPHTPTPKKRFTPPTLEEVETFGRDYCRDKLIDPDSFDPEVFFDFYASKGWRVGKAPMKDWRSACRRSIRDGWTLRNPQTSSPPNRWDIEHQAALKAFDEGAEVIQGLTFGGGV